MSVATLPSVMRSFTALFICLAFILTVAGQAAATAPLTNGSGLVTVATGTVSRLDSARIKVDRTTCELGTKGEALAGAFAVGEHVTMGCVRGVLRTIKLAPITSGPSHSVIVTSMAGASGSSPGGSAVYSSGTVSIGSGSVTNTLTNSGGQVASSASATGPITAITPTAITVGDTTCPFRSPPNGGGVLAQLQVGLVVSMGCTTYTNGSSTAQIWFNKQP